MPDVKAGQPSRHPVCCTKCYTNGMSVSGWTVLYLEERGFDADQICIFFGLLSDGKARVRCVALKRSTKLMAIATSILILLIAALHLYIMWFEMFAWESRGPKVFRSFPKDLFGPTKTMAANQGLYNGFLAVGLVWSRLILDAEWSHNVAMFFLICVLVAGIYGAMTASRRILFVQAVPAALAIGLLLVG